MTDVEVLIQKVLIIREMKTELKKGRIVANIIKKLKEIDDPVEISHRVTTLLLPMWSSLSSNYFPNTVKFLPTTLPKTWSYDEALLFLGHLSQLILPEIQGLMRVKK